VLTVVFEYIRVKITVITNKWAKDVPQAIRKIRASQSQI
jgi:hypothetical protein